MSDDNTRYARRTYLLLGSVALIGIGVLLIILNA